jgi:hypothetical protein
LPTGTDWPRIAVLLFAPSIIQDYLNMNAPNAKYVVNMAFGLVSLVIFIFNIFSTIQYRLDAKILRNLITWTMAITMVLLWITNKAAKEISVFAAMMATVVLYLQTVKNYYYYPHNVGISRNIIAAVIAWNLFLVDWKSIFAATISGQILSRVNISCQELPHIGTILRYYSYDRWALARRKNFVSDDSIPFSTPVIIRHVLVRNCIYSVFTEFL